MQALNERKSLTAQPANLVAPDSWESLWQQVRYPLRLDFRNSGIHALAAFLKRVLGSGDKSLIEIGCGASAWLPFFATEMGYRVYGVDLSPTGALIAQKNLEAFNIDGHIIQGDLFDRELLPLGAFDIVFSNGFIEHFPDTVSIVARMSSLLRPGGLMLTVVPNLQGLPGVIQKLVNRPVFEQHVVMDRSYLERVHREAGLETVEGPEYLGGFNLWAMNWQALLRGRSQTFLRVFGKVIAAANLAADLALRLCGVRDGWWVSHMIVIASRKPESAHGGVEVGVRRCAADQGGERACAG
jgi:SAM-dependent methyltransferase